MSHGENGTPYGERRGNGDAKRDGAGEKQARRIRERKPKTRIAKREKQKAKAKSEPQK